MSSFLSKSFDEPPLAPPFKIFSGKSPSSASALLHLLDRCPQHENWEFMPAFLSKYQRENPVKTIRWFCGWFTLHEARFFLMDMLRATMGSEIWKDDDPKQKAHVIWVIEELIDLIEGAYLMDEMINNDQLTYIVNSGKVQP